jgi:hypothetical protein
MAQEHRTPASGDDLTKVLSTLEGLYARMDSLEVGSGSKNPLKGDKRKDDDEDKEEKDDEFPPDKDEKKKDAKKDDDDEDDKDEKKDARKDQGSAPPAAATAKPPVADKKKDEFPPKKEDDAKKDEFPPKKEEKDDDDAKKDSRADAVMSALRRQIAEQDTALKNQSKIIERINAQLKPRSDDEHAAFADTQAKADSVFMGFGKAAPRPLEGESLLNYRKRLATHLKPYSTVWKSVKFSQLPEEAFNVAETQVYADATTAAAMPMDLGDGELREVARTDPRTGLKTISFYGRDSFVKQMGRPARRVASFRTQFPG